MLGGHQVRGRSQRTRRTAALAATAALLAATACSGASGTPSRTTSARSTTTTVPTGSSGVTAWPGQPVSPQALPLGDGKVATTPTVGSVDSCVTAFGAGGAAGTEPWIDQAAGTWDSTAKPRVAGATAWPDALHSFTVSGAYRNVSTDDLPSVGTTGAFPISPSDPAYAYDRNPNHVVPQTITVSLPATPSPASAPSCLGLGAIGVATNGVLLFDALDAGGRDAAAHEVQDSCDGHPQADGVYHYHSFSSCLSTPASARAGTSTLVGYAIDGYGIFLERDAHGNLPTDANLDACHGRTSTVWWDGRQVSMYHYDVTAEYPYLLGCYHGTPATSTSLPGGGAPSGGASPPPAGSRPSRPGAGMVS